MADQAVVDRNPQEWTPTGPAALDPVPPVRIRQVCRRDEVAKRGRPGNGVEVAANREPLAEAFPRFRECLELASVNAACKRCVHVREDEREGLSADVEARHDAGRPISRKVFDPRPAKGEPTVEPDSVRTSLTSSLRCGKRSRVGASPLAQIGVSSTNPTTSGFVSPMSRATTACSSLSDWRLRRSRVSEPERVADSARGDTQVGATIARFTPARTIAASATR